MLRHPNDRATLLDDLGVELYDTAQRLLRALRSKGRTSDLSIERLSALLALSANGHASIKELANSEHVAHSTMSRMVSSLTGSGLAEAHSHGVDRRTSSIKLTVKGKRTAQRGLDRLTEPLAAAVNALSPEEHADLVRGVEVLKSLLRSIEQK